MCNNKKLLVPSRMICVSLFLVLSSNIMMCAENKISMNTGTNEIVREKENIESRNNRTEKQRIDKRHINEDKFKAFECDEEADLSTAEFSLNEPLACRRADGSAYYPPEPKKAQILQKLQRIPVEVTICQVNLRVLVGWCGGEYVAMNYMHSFVETKRTLIQTTNIQCHHAAPNDTLEIEIPKYGTINRISC